jgi:hypothetical protein
MGSMKGKQTKIDAAFGRLADMIQSGHLLAGTDPVGFLDAVVAELKELRSENVKIRGLMSIEADKHNERQIMLQDTIERGKSFLKQWDPPAGIREAHTEYCLIRDLVSVLEDCVDKYDSRS